MQAEINKLNDYSIPFSKRLMIVENLYYNYIDDFAISKDIYDYDKYINHIKNIPKRKPIKHSRFFNINLVKNCYIFNYIDNVSQFIHPILDIDDINKKDSKNKYTLEDFGSLQIYNEQTNNPQSVIANNSLGICIIIPYKYKTDSLAAKEAANIFSENAHAISLKNCIEIRNNKLFVENICTYYLLVIKKTYTFPIQIQSDYDIYLRACLQIKMYIFGISSRTDECFGKILDTEEAEIEKENCSVGRIVYGCYRYDYKTPYKLYNGEYVSQYINYINTIPHNHNLSPYEYTRWCEIMTEIKMVLESE